MPLFSQRQGIRPLQKAIQRESMDEELRNRLWSAIVLIAWNGSYGSYGSYGHLKQAVWIDHLKRAADTRPASAEKELRVVRDHFYEGEWWQAYDLLEFLIKTARAAGNWETAASLARQANACLEAENAAYRVVGQEIVEITNEHEIEAIETALDQGSPAVRDHLRRALTLLSDRKQPDYRNAIKESISSVEAACQLVAGKPKATLGECLKALKDRMKIHGALEGAFKQLYGYTSDSGGIRHALAEGSVPPTYADAKFMLVACSAFTSFVMAKAAENGIDLSTPNGAG